jgi:hypothetical protein
VGKNQTVPYGTDFRLNLFQAINCLATIIQSLRDARGHHSTTPPRPFAHSPTRPFADSHTHPQYLSIAAAIAFARFSRAPGCTMRAASPGLVKKPHSTRTAGNRFLRKTK